MTASPTKGSHESTPPLEWPGGDLPPVEAYEDDAQPPPHRNGHDTGRDPLAARAPIGFRTLPHNIDAEQALLGAILVNNEAYDQVAGFLEAEHYYEPVHGRIYAAIKRLVDAGRVANYVTLKAAFDEDEALRELDGAQYLAAMARGAETILNAGDYGHLIHSLAVRRGVIAVAEAAISRAYDPTSTESASEQLASLRQGFEALAGADAHASPFQYLDHCDIADDLPLRPFIVERWIPLGCVTSLYGSGGTGKSFLALMIAMCVAAGRPWLGYQCKQATVLAVMCEDDEAELRRRRNKIARSLEISADDLAGRLWVTPRVGQPNALMEFPSGVATRTPLFERIITEAKQAGAGLVILDNVAQLYGGNENDRSQVTAFLNACAGIATETSGAVLLLGHPPKMPGVEFSGSTAWDAVVRSRIWFKRIEEEDSEAAGRIGGPERYTLELVKSNYQKRFGIELQENGHGIVEYVGNLVKEKKEGRQTSADRVFVAFRNLFETHRRAIAPDELVKECIHLAIYRDCEPGSAAWRDKRFKVRANLMKNAPQIDFRDDGYALKP